MSRFVSIARGAVESFKAGRLQDASESGEPSYQGIVAVLPLAGFMSSASQRWFRVILSSLAADAEVSAVVFETDCPGGDVFGNEDTAQAIAELREAKPVVFYAQGWCASAGYRLASEGSLIVANVDAQIGSIGSMIILKDESGAMENSGVEEYVWVSEISPDKVEDITSDAFDVKTQARVDENGLRFAQAIAERRGVSVEHVAANFGRGSVISAEAALAAGAVDEIGLLKDAVSAAMRLAADRQANTMAIETSAFLGAADTRSDHRADAAHHQEESATMAQLIKRFTASSLEKGLAAVREQDLLELEQRASQAEQGLARATEQRDQFKAEAQTATDAAKQHLQALTDLQDKIKQDAINAAEASRIEARDALIQGAVEAGKIGPQDEAFKQRMVAIAENAEKVEPGKGNDALAGMLEILPVMHAAAQPPQGGGGNPEPEAEITTREGFTQYAREIAAEMAAASGTAPNFNLGWAEAQKRKPDLFMALYGRKDDDR